MGNSCCASQQNSSSATATEPKRRERTEAEGSTATPTNVAESDVASSSQETTGQSTENPFTAPPRSTSGSSMASAVVVVPSAEPQDTANSSSWRDSRVSSDVQSTTGKRGPPMGFSSSIGPYVRTSELFSAPTEHPTYPHGSPLASGDLGGAAGTRLPAPIHGGSSTHFGSSAFGSSAGSSKHSAGPGSFGFAVPHHHGSGPVSEGSISRTSCATTTCSDPPMHFIVYDDADDGFETDGTHPSASVSLSQDSLRYSILSSVPNASTVSAGTTTSSGQENKSATTPPVAVDSTVDRPPSADGLPVAAAAESGEATTSMPGQQLPQPAAPPGPPGESVDSAPS